MERITPAGEVAKQACIDSPELPTRTLARTLRNEHPSLFSSIKNATSMVQYYRGNAGDRNRAKAASHSSTFREPGIAGAPIPLPKGITQAHKPIVMPPCKALILNDIHSPYHCVEAIQSAVAFGLDKGCDTLYLNGDTIDFYAISRFLKDPRKRDLRNEVDTTIEILKALAPKFANRYYKVGNHDERWDIFLFQRADDLIEFDEFSLSSVLKLDELGYKYVESKQWSTFSEFALLHGHEFARGIASPVNPARGVYLRLASTAAVGHFHRTSQHTDTHAISKQTTATWSIGCLCDLSPDYMPLNKWNLGFSTIEHDGKSFQFENYQICPTSFDVWSA